MINGPTQGPDSRPCEHSEPSYTKILVSYDTRGIDNNSLSIFYRVYYVS